MRAVKIKTESAKKTRAKSSAQAKVTQKKGLESTIAAIVLFVIGLTMPIAVFAGLTLAPIMVIMGVLAIFYYAKYRFLIHGNPAIYAVLTFWAYALVTCFWAINPLTSMAMWARDFFLVATALLGFFWLEHISEETRVKAGRMLMISVLVSLFLFSIEVVLPGAYGSIFGAFSNKQASFNAVNMNRGACFFALVFWPFVLGLATVNIPKKQVFIFVVWLAGLMVLTHLKSLSAVMGYSVGTLVYIFCIFTKSRYPHMLSVFAIFLIFTVPFAMQFMRAESVRTAHIPLPHSSLHRLYIWEFVTHKAEEKPLLGWGMHSAPLMPGGTDIILDKKGQVIDPQWHYLPLHPHNSILQIWLELGIPGLVLFSVMIVLLIEYIRKNLANASQKAAALALLASYFIIGLSGFGFWQNWWIAAGLLAALFLRIVLQDSNISRPRARAQN